MYPQVFLFLLLLIKCSGYQSSWNLDQNRYQIPQDVMVEVVNDLALKLLAIHNEGNDNNIAISPYGALSVVVALQEGVRGSAAHEFHRAANLPLDLSIVRIGLRDIHRHLKSYFIPEEGFLSGLTLSHDNVTLNREYEDILKFYGFDIDSFNNMLYPDVYTTERTTDITSTEDGTIAASTTQPITSTETSTIDNVSTTGSGEIIISTTDAETTKQRETTTTTTEVTTAPHSDDMESVITVATTVAGSTSFSTTTPKITTEKLIPTAEMTSTLDNANTVLNNVRTTPEVMTETARTEFTTEVSSTSEVSTKTDRTKFTPEVSSTIVESSTSELSTKADITTSTLEVSSTIAEFSTSEISIKVDVTTSTSEVSSTTAESSTLEISTKRDITRSIPEISSTLAESTTTEVTSKAEITESNTEVSSTVAESTIIPSTMTTLTESTSIKMARTETFDTDTAQDIDVRIKTDLVGMNDLNSTIEDEIENSSETTILVDNTTNSIEESEYSNELKNNDTFSRATRSVVDYIIARYYDDRIITQRPPPYNSENELYFLIDGKYKESNINYMTYDTVLPFHYIPHLNTLALRFPLDSSKYYLLLLLPENPRQINRLICDLRLNTSLKYIIDNLRYTHVKAIIPSFMLKGYVTLTSTFQKMGITRVFEPRQADFSPMTGDRGIYVTNIEQAITVNIKNYVDPATMNNNEYLHRTNPVLFKADHPFLYFVIDSEIDVTLMAGKIVNPLNSRIR